MSVKSDVAATTAGDGYARRAFTADEFFSMQDLGIIDEADGFELIDGDIVMMPSKNAPHERIKLALGLCRGPCPTVSNSGSRQAWC